MPHVSLKERFKKVNIEVELGFKPEQAAQEAQRCLNCDVQTVFEAKLCIECDACIDVCPVDCLTITAGWRGGGAAHAAARAGQGADAAPVRVAERCRRPAASWSRTRICACTVGCARSAARRQPGICRNRQFTGPTPEKVNPHAVRSAKSRKRLRHQDRDRERHGLGQRQRSADEGRVPQRRARGRQELLPLEHPGPADLVRDPRDPRRPPRPQRPGRHHGGAQRRDLRARPAGSQLGRLFSLRLHLAASGADDARRRHGAGRAVRAPVQREFQPACAPAS